jgi:putative phosphonate catabolism associated alcohol dehydrogenase
VGLPTLRKNMNNYSRAMVFTRAGDPLKMMKFPLPTLREGEILVHIEYATICGSDLHTFMGKRSTPSPTILGHEIFGRIVELPIDNTMTDFYGNMLAIDDLITWSIAASCGKCFYCNNGMQQKCTHLFKYGHERISNEHPLSGGYAEYCHIAKGTTIVKVPDGISKKVFCPANCATATMAAAYRVAGACKGQTVLIQGAGMLGLSALAMARYYGAKEVIALDISKKRLIEAKKFGATKTVLVTSDTKRVIEDIKNITKGAGVDLAIEVTGVKSSMETGFQLMRIGGRYILVGAVFPNPPILFPAEKIVRNLLSIHGIHNYTPKYLAEAIKFLVESYTKYPFEDLVGKEFYLDETNEAFQYMVDSKAFRIAIVNK